MSGRLTKMNALNSNGLVRYQWVESGTDLNQALDSGLTSLYQTCFGAAPWNEFYTDDDVKNVFYNYQDKGSSILIACNGGDRVVGFSVKMPLTTLPSGIIVQNNAVYCYGADLGVDPNCRRLGLSTALECLQREKMQKDYDIELTRTSVSSYGRIASNLRQGKRRLSYTEDVEMKRTDGSIGQDKRIYFALDLKNAESRPDDQLERVIVANWAGSVDTALVFGRFEADKKEITMMRVQDNYPGIKSVVFQDPYEKNISSQQDFYEKILHSSKNDKDVAVLFNGTMPLNYNQLTL